MSPPKEPEVEKEEKTTLEESPLLLALESYPDFEDSEDRIVLMTPTPQASLRTNPTPERSTCMHNSLTSPIPTSHILNSPTPQPSHPMHNTRTTSHILNSLTPEALGPLTPTQRPRATPRQVGKSYDGKILDANGYLMTEAVQDLHNQADRTSPALALPTSISVGTPPPQATVSIS